MEDQKQIFSIDEDKNSRISELTQMPIVRTSKLSEIAKYFADIPAIWSTIQSVLPADKILVADIPQHIQRLIESGDLTWGVDRAGDMLAQVKKGGKIVEQIRLKEVTEKTDVLKNLQDLHVQNVLAQIVEGLKAIHTEVLEVLGSIQDDRYALCDSAERQLISARLIKSQSLQCQCYALLLQTAEDGKNKLMRAMVRDVENIKNKPISFWNDLRSFSDTATMQRLNEIENGFYFLTKTATIEAMALNDLNEQDALISSVGHLVNFLDNNFDETTLLKLNSHSDANKKDYFIEELPKRKLYIKSKLDEVALLTPISIELLNTI